MKNDIVYYIIVNKKEVKNNNLEDKNETKKARIILKKMLECFNQKLPEIKYSKTGKPYFKDSGIYFNYSHSKNYIACAISNKEIGIDIEETNTNISDKVSNKYLDNEKETEKRIEKWVKKEAYSKLKGLGLQINFQKIKLDEIKEESFLIKDNKYICAIFYDGNNVEFKKLSIKNL